MMKFQRGVVALVSAICALSAQLSDEPLFSFATALLLPPIALVMVVRVPILAVPAAEFRLSSRKCLLTNHASFHMRAPLASAKD